MATIENGTNFDQAIDEFDPNYRKALAGITAVVDNCYHLAAQHEFGTSEVPPAQQAEWQAAFDDYAAAVCSVFTALWLNRAREETGITDDYVNEADAFPAPASLELLTRLGLEPIRFMADFQRMIAEAPNDTFQIHEEFARAFFDQIYKDLVYFGAAATSLPPALFPLNLLIPLYDLWVGLKANGANLATNPTED